MLIYKLNIFIFKNFLQKFKKFFNFLSYKHLSQNPLALNKASIILKSLLKSIFIPNFHVSNKTSQPEQIATTY